MIYWLKICILKIFFTIYPLQSRLKPLQGVFPCDLHTEFCLKKLQSLSYPTGNSFDTLSVCDGQSYSSTAEHNNRTAVQRILLQFYKPLYAVCCVLHNSHFVSSGKVVSDFRLLPSFDILLMYSDFAVTHGFRHLRHFCCMYICRAMLQDTLEECTIQRWLQGLPVQVLAILALRAHVAYHSHIQLAMQCHLVVLTYHQPTLHRLFYHPVLAIPLDMQLHRHMALSQLLCLVITDLTFL